MTTQTPTKPTREPSDAMPRPEGRTPRPTHTAPFAPSAFYPPDQPAPVPREPGLTDPHHRLLQTLTSPEVSTITLCEIHTLTLAQIAELTGSETFEDALAAAERIAQFRLRLLKLEAEQLAWARLTDLARRHPVTPREQETSRKAAAQILRETKKAAAEIASPGLPGGAGEVPERSGGGGGPPSASPTPAADVPARTAGNGILQHQPNPNPPGHASPTGQRAPSRPSAAPAHQVHPSATHEPADHSGPQPAPHGSKEPPPPPLRSGNSPAPPRSPGEADRRKVNNR